MNLIIFPYNPDVIRLNSDIIKKFDLLVICSKHLEEKYREMGVYDNCLFLDKKYFNPKDLWKKLAEFKDVERVCSLPEELMDFSGQANDYFKLSSGPSYLTANIFRDKYLMRYANQDVVINPQFSSVDNKDEVIDFFREVGKSIIVKPRYGAASEGVQIFHSEEEIKISSLNFRNCVAEEFIRIEKMYTVDGYAMNGKIKKIFFHEYDKPLAETLNDRDYGFYIRTSKLYQDKKLMTNLGAKLLKYTKDFIDNSSKEGEIFPFHFEYFLDKEGKVVFCEAGARFGGANIPELIHIAHNIDVAKMYFEDFFSFDKEKNYEECSYIETIEDCDIANKIACTYMPYRKEGLVRQVPEQEIFNFTIRTRIIVKPNQEVKNSTSIIEKLFISIFEAKDEDDFANKITLLNKIRKEEFIID